ncbi:MAG: hypothetical protein QM638_01060 [Nocardioides sp.]|uniref:DUF7666 domain-containing protein n=1 Tax=Nocardioides sp. TaxID=35761 RepID=UPI0039E30300
MSTIVTTQAEYDAALAALDGAWGIIEVRSPAGVWISIKSTDSATVEAWGSATVRASGSATVEAWSSATVEASDSANVDAWGSATVDAWGSANVHAWGSANVKVSGRANVEASGRAVVKASGSATVKASDSATVHAWGCAVVHAAPHVAVYLHSKNAVVEGGVLIDVTEVEKTSTAWLEHHGIEVRDGVAVLFKAVDANLHSDQGFAYPLGETVACDDWRPDNDCGGGLHLSPRPVHAKAYHNGPTLKLLACAVDVDTIRVIPDSTPKCKVPSLTVLHQVDLDGVVVSDQAARRIEVS